ncbi:unnamed protein product, partial [Meganyctiphanes norvegica]
SADNYGSLDRSLARRNRIGRHRPSLLSTESAERDRPSSPSIETHLLDNKPELPDQNRPSKNWRQKIESWFKENEKEERRTEINRNSEIKRKMYDYRKSLDLDSQLEDVGSGVVGGLSNVSATLPSPGGLGTLPEDHPTDDLASAKTAATGEEYKRVYGDLKPSMDKIDVVGAMEAIAEAHSPASNKEKDKSTWRKSNLNVSNSSEATAQDLDPRSNSGGQAAAQNGATAPTLSSSSSSSAATRRLRRLRSRSNIEPGQVVQAMDEPIEDDVDAASRRSSLIQTLGRMDSEDTLRVFIRRPSQDLDGTQSRKSSTQTDTTNNDARERRGTSPALDIGGDSGSRLGVAVSTNRRSSAPSTSLLSTESPANKAQQELLQRYRHSVDVSADILRSIEEAEQDNNKGTESEEQRREKKAYKRTITPSSLRTALQQRLKDNLQSAHLVGAIKSLDDDTSEVPEEEEQTIQDENISNVLDNSQKESSIVKTDDQKLLTPPPNIPPHLRRLSREEGQLDDIDAENIETPPITRRADGLRSFRAPASSNWVSQADDEENGFHGKRMGRRFRSLNSEERRVLDSGRKSVPSEGDSDNLRIKSSFDSSDNEGEGSEKKKQTRVVAKRSQRFKTLAALAKDGDSETEQMLSRQVTKPEDELGDGQFNRYSSQRKTFRHKKLEKQDAKSSEENAEIDEYHTGRGMTPMDSSRIEGNVRSPRASPERILSTNVSEDIETHRTEVVSAQSCDESKSKLEDKDARLKRWERKKEFRDQDSLMDKISRRFRTNNDKYDVQKAMEENKRKTTTVSLKPPASERLIRKNQDNVPGGLQTMGSFRSTLSPQDRQVRSKSNIDPGQVKEAIQKDK